jgi:hypothetical protein
MKSVVALVITHGLIGVGGFALGIYLLPILIAPPPPDSSAVSAFAADAVYSGTFKRDLADSDALHWGEGQVSISREKIVFMGSLAPGPDYQLYLSPQFVETEADFNRLKADMQRVGHVNTFANFIVDLPPGLDPDRYNSVIVWCESFGQFITAAQYR